MPALAVNRWMLKTALRPPTPILRAFSGGAAVHRGGRTLDPHFQFLAAAGFDPLVDQGLEYAKALAAAGVPFTYRCYDSLPHGFVSFTTVPAARAAVRQIALLMRERYDQL